MIVRLFAAAYPDEAAGLILVDTVHESHYLPADLTESRRQQRRDSVKLARLGYLVSPIALPRFVGRHIGSKWLPSPAREQVKAVGYRNNTYMALYAELLDAHESALQLASAEPLRQDLPVIVLSAGRRDENWKKGQAQMLKLTRRNKQIIVEDSWHSIQIHRPEVVIDAIRSLMK
jgi:pimeloyl-ACP methyl ester carboxylesterase